MKPVLCTCILSIAVIASAYLLRPNRYEIKEGTHSIVRRDLVTGTIEYYFPALSDPPAWVINGRSVMD